MKDKNQSLSSFTCVDVWEIVEGGYQYPTTIPTDPMENKSSETNVKGINALLGNRSELEFIKVMPLNIAKEIWDKIIHTYEGAPK